MKILNLLGCAALLTLAACSETMTSSAATTGAGATADAPTAAMPSDTRGFVMMAGSSDMFEIQSSQLAKQRGVSGELATFADQMIADHTRTSSEMKALLSGMGPPMTPQTEMNAKHDAMFDRLEAAGDGAAFARAYVEAQRMAHDEAVALYTAYSQKGDNPTLRQFAQKTLPALQGHLEHVQRLASSDAIAD